MAVTSDTGQLLSDTLRRMLRRNARPSLRNIVNKAHPADLARTFDSLSPTQQATFST